MSAETYPAPSERLAMRRAWFPLLLLLAAILLVGVLLGQGAFRPGEWPEITHGGPGSPGGPDGDADAKDARAPLLLGTGEVTKLGEPTKPGEPAELRGRVVDAETGEGIAGARIFLWPRYALPPDDVVGTLFPVKAADREGRFAFRGGFERVGRGQPLDLHAFGVRHLPGSAEIELPGEVEIRLEPGRTLTGWVVDEQRRPLPNARIRAYAPGESPPGVAKGVHPTRVHASTWARDDGAFTLTGVSPGFVLVDAVSKAGRCSAAVGVAPEHEEPLEIRVPLAVRVTIVVRAEDGGPLPLGHLSSYAPYWETVLWETGYGEEAPLEKRVANIPLPPGPMREKLLLWVPGYLPRIFDLEPAASEQTCELVMVRKHEAGTVRLRLGWPEAETWEPSSVVLRVISTDTNWAKGLPVFERQVVPAGRSEVILGPLPEGVYRLEGIGRTVAAFAVEISVVAKEERVQDLDLGAAGGLEVVFEDAPATGVGFALSWAEEHEGQYVGRVARALQDHGSLEHTLWEEEDLRDGMRWGDSFLATPDGERQAVARVYGLAARRYGVHLLPPHDEDYTPWDAVEIRAGETTRVKIRRRE